MAYTNQAGYGRSTSDAFPAFAPHGRQFIVGAATLDNIRIAQETFKHDTDGIIRMYTSLMAAIAGIFQNVSISVTASAAADTLTSTAAHGLSNGDKIQLQGTSAPGNTTLGVIYYVVAATTLSFKVSLQRGGTAIDLSSAGTAVKVLPVQAVGDVIYVLPSHNENVSSATAFNVNVSGVSIIGLGEDEARPTFYLDTGTTTTFTFSAPAVLTKNIIFDGTGFDAIATMLTITASDVHFDSCKFVCANSTNQATLGITTNALCDRFKFSNNRVVGTTDAGMTNFLQMVGGNDVEIVNNYFYGAYTTTLGAINNATTAGLRWRIEANQIVNATASSTKAVVLVSTTTGVIRNNTFSVLSGSASAAITAAGISSVSGNYATYAAGTTAGTLI